MTDFLAPTPELGRKYCPDCEPDVDPTKEILDVRWCASHHDAARGTADGEVEGSTWISGSSECEGLTNKLWNDLLLRGIRPDVAK